MLSPDNALLNLSLVLDKLAGLTPDHASQLYHICRRKSLSKGEFYIHSGDIPKTFAFVNSGLFRYVYMDEEGRQFTKGFMPEFGFISSYSAMIGNYPSFFYIEALENADLLEISYSTWLTLKESCRCWDRFLIAILEKGFTKKETRERELLLVDAETRYKLFLEEYPTLASRVKLHMVASYLGITPESLSRIRQKTAFP